MANGYANMTWTPSHTFSVSTHLFHVGGSRGMVQALPPATNRLQAAVEGFDPVQTSFGTLNALYRPNDRLAAQVLLGYSDRHNVAFAATAAGTTTTRDYDREFTAGVTQSIAVTGSNTLRAGGNYNHWVAPYGKRFYAGRRSDLETYSLTLSDEQRIGRFIVDGGVRYHRTYINEYGAFNINEDAAPYRNVPSLRNQWEPAAMSATLGAAYSLNEHFSVHGNVVGGTVDPRRGTLTAAFEPPRRERRLTGDIGFRVNKSRLGSATISFFSVRRDDGINLSGGIKTINGRVMEFYENRDQYSKGIEVDLRSRRFRNAVQVFVNSTLMTARIDSGTAMLRDREMPRAISGAGVSFSRWRFDSNVFWKYVSNYQSSRFAESAIAQPLGGFNAFDFTLGRRIGPRRQSRLYAEMKNVTENRFSTVVGYPDYGRRVVAGVEHSF
jgi:outer membrane cobalamin receptor